MQNETNLKMKLFKRNRLLASLLLPALLVGQRTMHAQTNTLIDGNNGVLPTPPGLFVTPTASLTDAKQQLLNPGLANYPDYIAGEAVKAVVSPDGRTLAILTAGQNSLYKLGWLPARSTRRLPRNSSFSMTFPGTTRRVLF